MSSATSIDRGSVPQESDGFKPWHFFVLASLLAATAAVVMSRRATPEHLVLISLTIGAAGAAGAGLYRMLAPLAAKDSATPVETLSDRLRATLEREKALALRSIKELEFDRAMGKVSDRDFEEMAARLRARALTLMKQLSQGDGGYRELVERELAARMSQRGPAARTAAAAKAPGSTATPAAAPPADVPSACESCGTINDEDASFCKRCGRPLGRGEETAE